VVGVVICVVIIVVVINRMLKARPTPDRSYMRSRFLTYLHCVYV
jgi:hypothetical protein